MPLRKGGLQVCPAPASVTPVLDLEPGDRFEVFPNVAQRQIRLPPALRELPFVELGSDTRHRPGLA
jgi:hypothetical protein